MNKPIDRRKFLIGIAGVTGAAALGCKTVYECEGVPVARPTDGQLVPTAASYFNSGQAVTQYDPELADVVNETWVKELGKPIDEKICIQYYDSLPSENLSGTLAGQFHTEKKFSASKMRYEKEKTARILNKMEPFGNLDVISHELRHNESEAEYLPMLTSHRMGTMAAVNNPQFGADTQYFSFGVSHGVQSQYLRDAFANSWTTIHHIGSVAALLALNQTNGDYVAADYELRKNSGVHVGNAQTFIDYSRAQQRVFSSPGSEIHIVSTTSGDQVLPSIPFHELAVFDLWFKVAHQVLKFNVDQNATLDDATKTAMKQGMKTIARFPLASIPANSGQGPRIVDYQIFYQEGFTNPLSFIINPPDYDYSIPKGL